MQGEAVREIENMARRYPIEANGRHYVPTGYNEAKDRTFPPLTVHTLQALVEYLLADVDGLYIVELEEALRPPPFIHVESPSKVSVVLPVDRDAQRRDTALEARYSSPIEGRGGIVGTFVPVELGIIQLQTFFEDTEDRAEVLKLVGNVKDEGVRTQSDDGVSQTVTARKGVALAEDVPVPRIVHLRPYRTFPELEQPASPFVMRLRSGQQGIEVGLFEADNGLWALEAIAGAGAWLAERLGDSGHVIIA